MADPADNRPLWIYRHKSDDSIYMYRIGSAAGETAATARAAALEDARRIIQEEIMARGGLEDALRRKLRGELALRHVEPIPDGIHIEKHAGGYNCWIQVSYPLAERDRLLEEIAVLRRQLHDQAEFDAQMNRLWEQARAAAIRGEHADALAMLQELEANYATLLAPAAAIEEIRLLIGDTQRELRDPLAARGSYETVAGVSTAAVWQARARERLAGLPPPPRLWPMQSRWPGRVMAQHCTLRTDDGPAAPFPELAAILHRDFSESRMPLADIKPRQDALPDQWLPTRDTAAIVRLATEVAADIVLAVEAHVDTSLQGQTRELMGVRMPVPDTNVSFMVIDATNGQVVYAGEFREMRSNRPAARLAERIAAIMINNYLIPHCPALPAPDRN